MVNFCGMSQRQAEAATLELLETVGLSPAEQFASKNPHQLSGGQRQRVVVARALAPEPGMIIVDEPISSLDVSIRVEILQLLDKPVRDHHIAMLNITHDLLSARLLSDEILVLNKGKVVEHGQAKQIITLPKDDYTQQLPMARPGKVGMWGYSCGASVTLAALTVTDQIAAAVAYAPAPADLAEDYARRKRNSGGNPGSTTWPFTPEQDPEAYRRLSPITYLDAVRAPVMLHHGTADSTVDEGASVAIAETLRAAGKEVTLYLYEGSGHALQGAAYDLYAERTLRFFQTHLGAK